MANNGTVVGMIRLRQVYSRRGKNYFAISLPTRVVDLLGWSPQDLLWYYPTTNKGMMLVKVTDMTQLMPSFDPLMLPDAKPVRGPRPGSLEERALEVEEHMDKITDELVAATRKWPKPKVVDPRRPGRSKYRSAAARARRR